MKGASFLSVGLGAALCAVALAGCVSEPHRTSEQRVTDNDTAAAVENALHSDKGIYTEHIKVRVVNGVVHLSGYVWSDFDQYQAKQVASTVPGVTQVVDEMELEREGMDNSPVTR